MAARAQNKEDKMEKIVVVVRVRPLHKGEATQRSPWKLSSKSIASSKTCRPSVPCYSFTYDKVYGTKGTTLEIYEAHVKGIINSAISGANGTIFAYGQSGSGKTCTMRGLPEESGILVLAVQDVFKRIQEERDREFLVRVSYFELDNEELIDLLASKNQKLDVHEDVQGSIVVAGLREEIVVGTEQVLALIEFADARSAVSMIDGSNCRRRPHSIFQMVIESIHVSQENLLVPQGTDAVQISVLNLVEVAATNTGIVENDSSFLRDCKSDKSLITLDTVMGKLSENAERKGESLPYSDSKLTYLLKPSLGGNTRTCFICHVSPAMVHMDATVETLTFAAKATRVMNCFKTDETWRNRPILKRQKREMEELCNKLKKHDSHDLEDVVNRRNALLMIELEREKMAIELFGKASLVCGYEDLNQEQNGEGLLRVGKLEPHKKNKVEDYRTHPQTEALSGYCDELHQVDELQDGDQISKRACDVLWLRHSGSKRKKRSSIGKVAEKFDQVDLLFQSKTARELNFLKAEGIAERQLLTELRNLIEQQDKEQQEHKDNDCKDLQQKNGELEKEKVMMEKKLCEQEISFGEAVESLKGQLATEKARQVLGGLPVVHSCSLLNMILPIDGEKQSGTSQSDENSKGVANFEGEGQETGMVILGSVVKLHTEAQSCLSQESEDKHKVVGEMEGKHTSTKRKCKANKVYQKYQNVQGRSEISTLRKELAVANETISALEDERDGLLRDLKQVKTDASRSVNEDKVNAGMIIEDIKGDNHWLHLLAAAVDELKAEVESTLPITDAVLELVLEAFQTLTANLNSFQEGVAELNVLNCTTTDLSQSLERVKLQLVALRHGKLSSEKDLHSMKSELAKLECVVERQSGVLKVLSDNESLLSELSSVRAAMKEAAGASELRLLSIQQVYNTKLEELECQCKNLKQENLQLDEKYSDIQSKLQSAQAEVHTLTQALQEKSEVEKKLSDIDIAEADAPKLSQATEKSKVEKKKKYSKSRQNTTQAEILRLTHSLGEKSELQEEIKRLQGDLSTSRTQVENLEREVECNYKARQEVWIQLKNPEDTVVRLTVELEEKTRVEADQVKKIACMESEVVKVTKLLQDTKLRAEAHQRELIISHEKVENLSRELEEMNALKNSYSKTLDRLVQSETEVARLTEIITSQLEDRSILEQDHTNFLYKLESSEREITRLTTSLNIVLQENERLGKVLERVSVDLSKSEAHVARLTKTLVKEKMERKVVEEGHLETLEKLVKEQEKVKFLGNSNEELICQLTQEQQEKKSVEEINQQVSDMLTKDQEVGKQLEEKNRGRHATSTSKDHEGELVEKKSEELRDKLASLETKVMQLTKKLAARARETSELENMFEEIRDHFTQEQETRNSLEEEKQEILEQPSSLESKVAQLMETVTTNLQATKPLKSPDKHIKEEKDIVQVSGGEILHEFAEEEERGPLEEVHQTVLQNHCGSEAELALMTETLARELREKKILQKYCEKIPKNIHKERGQRRAFEIKSQENLFVITGNEELQREVLEKTNQTLLQNVGGPEAHVLQLTETVTKELKGKNRLGEHHQEILTKLTGEQHERRALEAKYEEILKKLAITIDDRDLLEKAKENLVDKLAISEAKLGELADRLTTELQEKCRIQHRHEEIVEELTSDQEHRLIQMNNNIFGKGTREDGGEVLKRNRQNCLDTLAGLEGKLVEFRDNLASEVQDKNNLKLEYRTVFHGFECLKAEVARLTGSLTRELDSNDNFERHRHVLLAQLASSHAVVARVSASLEGVAEKGKWGTDHLQMLTRFATEELDVGNLTTMVDQTPQLKELLHNLQVEPAVLEGKLLRQMDEKRESYVEEHKLLLLELDATKAEIKSLRGQKKSLRQEQVELLARISILETKIRRLNDELREKLRVEEEHKDANILKTEASNLTVSLREKSELKVEQQNMQLGRLSQQGEILKPTKAICVSRKVVTEQKDLIHKLTNTQAEVLRLTSALGGRSGASKVQVDQNTETDPSVTGIPCGNCGLLTLNEEQVGLPQKLASTESEVPRLGNVMEEKAFLENKLESVQMDLSVAKSEIARLTKTEEDKSRLDEQFKRFQLMLSETGLLRAGKDTNGYECRLEGFPSELLKMVSDLEDLKSEVEVKAVELAGKEQRLRDAEIGSDVDFESLNTIITLREKERDELRQQCTVAESKVHNLSVEIERQKELESSEKKLKVRCHKAERDAAEMRTKLGKLEEATGWLVQDKGLLEERLTCCELQLTAAREAARSTNKELELSHHQIHVQTAQHQSEMAALCEELSVNKAQKAELEAELNRLLGQPHQPPHPLQVATGFLPNPHLLNPHVPNPHFRVPWPFPRGPCRNLGPTWGDGKR